MAREKYIRGSIRERLLAYTEILPNGCWRWTGKLNASGYGILKVSRKWKLSHRLSHEEFKQCIIPPSLSWIVYIQL